MRLIRSDLLIRLCDLPARRSDAAGNTAYNYRIIGAGFAFVCLFLRAPNMRCTDWFCNAPAAADWYRNGASSGSGGAALQRIRTHWRRGPRQSCRRHPAACAANEPDNQMFSQSEFTLPLTTLVTQDAASTKPTLSSESHIRRLASPLQGSLGAYLLVALRPGQPRQHS